MYNLYDGLDAMVTAAAPPRAARALFLCGGVRLGHADDIEAVGISCGVIVDNYDVANCSRHDLTSTALQRRVLADIAALKYDFVHAGPRCRSYSIRHVPPCVRRRRRVVSSLSRSGLNSYIYIC